MADRVLFHRRRARVVVRAPGATGPLHAALDERRRHLPTLPGLGGFDDADTIPDLDVLDDDDPGPVSHVRARVAPVAVRRIPKAAPPPPSARARLAQRAAGRSRPVTLIDDVHDDLSRRYLAEAEQLLASGAFGKRR